MRKIGHIDEFADAVVFSDYLYSQAITNDVDGDEVNGADIWVHDEDLLDRATTEFSEFVLNTRDEKYVSAGKKAEDLRHKEKRDNLKYSRKIHNRSSITNVSLFTVAPVTFILIILSVIVTLVAGLGSGSPLTPWLSIAHYETVGNMIQYNTSLTEIMHGQIWRLVTPIFIHASIVGGHMGLLHILFNMMWLKDLGKMIERAQGAKGMLWKVLVLAVLSNLGQFYIHLEPAFNGGPTFGGMSGVVFGLLGYCWMRGKHDITSGLYVNGQTAGFMIAWFVICLFGFMGPVANGAHGVGLAVGVIWGYLSARRVSAGA